MKEATSYVEINKYGSAVIANTNIHVDGQSEESLLEQFHIDRVQFHGALAYFYQNREALQAKTEQAIQEAIDKGDLQTDTLARLRKRQSGK